MLAYHLDNLFQIPLGLQTMKSCPEVVSDISFGAGPPPVFLLSLRNFVNSLLAAE